MKKIMDKTKQMIDIETKLGKDVEEVLRYMYVDLDMDIHKMAKVLNISHPTLLKWLRLAGVYSRKLRVGS